MMLGMCTPHIHKAVGARMHTHTYTHSSSKEWISSKQWGFPGGSAGKESSCSVGDLSSIPGLGRSPGEGKVYIVVCVSEKAMAPHSSTLAWKIPWMEEPGRLQSMGSLTVRHDWVISLSLFTFMHWRRKCNPLQCSCLENPRDGGA